MSSITSILTVVFWRLVFVACILAVYFAIRSYWNRKRRATDKPPDSIVLLLARHSPLNPQYLSIVVSRALQREVPAMDLNADPATGGGDPGAPAGDCIMGAAPHFMLSLDGGMFLVHSVPAPYVDPAEFKDAFRELRTKAAIESHNAWLSVDAFGSGPNPASHRIMGKIAAEFVGPNCLALYHPPTEKIIPVTPETSDELQAKLRSESPVEALFGPEALTYLPVIPVEDDNPRLVAAMDEARRNLPEFVKAFRESDGQSYLAVKTKLESQGNAEHVWVEVKRIEQGIFSGVLTNEPVNLEDYRIGAHLDVKESQIEDWCILRKGDEPKGMFTMAAIEEIESTKNS